MTETGSGGGGGCQSSIPIIHNKAALVTIVLVVGGDCAAASHNCTIMDQPFFAQRALEEEKGGAIYLGVDQIT